MQTYKQYRPTGFDCRGLGLPDRQDWLVLDLIQTRDSGSLEESNFAAALRILGGESETVEVHRFGHWGPGWYEIILVHPDRADDAEEIEASLENSCVLDEEDLSEREHEAYIEAWESYGYADFCDELARNFGLQWETKYTMRDSDTWKLLSFYESHVTSGDYYSESYGFRFDIAIRDISREELAAFLRANRPRRVAA